jgi:hypothetical protein
MLPPGRTPWRVWHPKARTLRAAAGDVEYGSDGAALVASKSAPAKVAAINAPAARQDGEGVDVRFGDRTAS